MTKSTDPEAVQRADPAARRRAFWIITISGVAGVLAVYALEVSRPAWENWLAASIEHPDPVSLYGIAYLLALPLLVVSGYFLHFARAIVSSRRFPPNGYKVIRDTPIITGTASLRKGRLLMAIATVLLIVALVIPAAFVHVLLGLINASV